MSDDGTKEEQYGRCMELYRNPGPASLGPMTNQTWYDDPRRLGFVLARYKFAAKMLSGKKRVLELGCADAFGTRIVLQEVESVCATDFDPLFVSDVHDRMDTRWKFDCVVHDILDGPMQEKFDAAYALDVIEHIPVESEHQFMRNIAASLNDAGVLIIGSPSLQSQSYASPLSKEGHVNCKDGLKLKALMQEYFDNVFLFSMNDEVVHTGYHSMAHYLFTVCAGKRSLGL